jgi:hypothetical protein
VSAEHASRMHLIRGNGSPSTLQIAVGDNLANSAGSLEQEIKLQSRWFMATAVGLRIGACLG